MTQLNAITRAIVCLICVFLLIPTSGVCEEELLTNDGVVRLCSVGLNEDVIIHKIVQATRFNFNLGVEDLVRLKSAGVSGAVINAMLARAEAGQSLTRTEAPPASLRERSAKAGTPVLLLTDGKSIALESGHDSDGIAKIRVHPSQLAIVVAGFKAPLGDYSLSTLTLEPTQSRDPDTSSSHAVIPCTQEEVEVGVWQVRPKRVLSPGEYALLGPTGEAYRFGIDASENEPESDTPRHSIESAKRMSLDIPVHWSTETFKEYPLEDYERLVSPYSCDGVSFSRFELRQVKAHEGRVEWKVSLAVANGIGDDKLVEFTYGLWCHDALVDSGTESIAVEEEDTNSWSFRLEADRSRLDALDICLLRTNLAVSLD